MISIADMVVRIGLFTSKGVLLVLEPRYSLTNNATAQVKQAIQNGTLTVNGVKVDNLNALLTAFELLDGSVAVVNAGKRAIKVIEVV